MNEIQSKKNPNRFDLSLSNTRSGSKWNPKKMNRSSLKKDPKIRCDLQNIMIFQSDVDSEISLFSIKDPNPDQMESKNVFVYFSI